MGQLEPLLLQLSARLIHLGLILATIFGETLAQISPKTPKATQRDPQTLILHDCRAIQTLIFIDFDSFHEIDTTMSDHNSSDEQPGVNPRCSQLFDGDRVEDVLYLF